MSQALLETKKIAKVFNKRQVLSDLNLEIREKEFVAILGPSGCGKSTLLRILAGLESVTSGEILRANSAHRSSFVFQEHRLLPWLRIDENVRIGLGPQAHHVDTKPLLKNLGLESHGEDFPASLSGGQKMRASLARALISNPSLMFMDEPFSALDEITKDRLQDDLRKTFDQSVMTVLFVTHSPSEAAFLADRVLVMGEGRIKHDFPSPLKARESQTRTSEEFFRFANEIRARMQS